jgi:hypothetical protein
MDIALMINEFLKDKQELKTFDDELNIVEGQIVLWKFANIPQPTTEELEALIPAIEASQVLAARKVTLKTAGAKDRAMCENTLDLIAGFNRERVLTAEQITSMQTTFATINAYLKANRPSSAKPLIEAITPDNDLVTQEMKDLILDELKEA